MSVLHALLGAGAGAIVGSFLATLCIRWEKGEQVVTGRSRCDHCRRQLGWKDLVPIVSFIASRAQCRTCGTRIAPLHVGVEVAAALIGGTAMAFHAGVSGAALALFGWLLLPLLVLDARQFWLPDRLTLLLAATGILLGGHLLGTTLPNRLIGGAIGFALLELVRIVYRMLRGREGLGAGDPKLLGAIALWLGWTALPFVLLLASLGGLAVAVALGAGRLSRFPFGAALAASAWVYASARLTGI